MGKATLFIAMAAILAIGTMLYQSGVVSQESDQRQSERESLMIAREIARSGYESAKSVALKAQADHPSWEAKQVVEYVNGIDSLKADMQGGKYKAWLEVASASSYRIYSRGTYLTASHLMVNANSAASGTITRDKLETVDSTRVELTLNDPTATYCTTIYAQFIPPHSNNGHGNNADGVDCSNPGKNYLKRAVDTNPLLDDENRQESPCLPIMVYPPGKNRVNASKTFEKTVPKGWKINFKLAIDQQCSRIGDTSVQVSDKMFETVRDVMRSNITDLTEMQEGEYAIIQRHPMDSKIYRISFEDRVFDTRQLADVKKNSYGTSAWNSRTKTYGGNGWFNLDPLGFYQLVEYSDRPDFNDQVLNVKLEPLTPAIVSVP